MSVVAEMTASTFLGFVHIEQMHKICVLQDLLIWALFFFGKCCLNYSYAHLTKLLSVCSMHSMSINYTQDIDGNERDNVEQCVGVTENLHFSVKSLYARLVTSAYFYFAGTVTQFQVYS